MLQQRDSMKEESIEYMFWRIVNKAYITITRQIAEQNKKDIEDKIKAKDSIGRIYEVSRDERI